MKNEKTNNTELVDRKYKWYLYDLGLIIKERALQAKSERNVFRQGSADYDFQTGRLIGLNEVISILQQQAQAFGIEFKELQIEDINPDVDLV